MTTTIDTLRAEIAGMIEVPVADIGDDDVLVDLGLDSLRAMNLASDWEDRGLPIDFADLSEARTLRDIWALVSREGNNA